MQENFESSFKGFEATEDVICYFSEIEKSLNGLKIEQGVKKYFTSLFDEFKEGIFSEETEEARIKLKDSAQKLIDFVAPYTESEDEDELRFSALVSGVAFKALYRASEKGLEK